MEAVIATEAGSATVKVPHRTSSGSCNISRSNSSISRGTSESSPRSSSSRSSSNISHSTAVSAATSATIARTSLRGMWFITRLFKVWSARTFPVRVPCRTSYTEYASSGPVRERVRCHVFIFWRLRQFWDRTSSNITVNPREAGPAWTACSVRVVLELFHRLGHPGAVYATKQVAYTKCKCCNKYYCTW